jgi:hypothetical protein
MLSRTRRRLEMAGLGDRAGILSCGCRTCRSSSTRSITPKASTRSSRISARSTARRRSIRSASIGCRHLRAGGAMAIGLMGRTCLWETLYFTARGDRQRLAAPHGASGRAGGRHRRADVLSPAPRRARPSGGFVRDAVDRHRRDGAAAVPRAALAAGAAALRRAAAGVDRSRARGRS